MYKRQDPYSLSLAEIEGRKQCQELEKFMKSDLEGFQNIHMISTGPSIGVRESRQIKGYYQFTSEDILLAKIFDDVIAHSAYPIDVHSPDGEGKMCIRDRYYRDRAKWSKMCLVNIAQSGYFSSDRTIEEYVSDIWKLDRVKR